MANTTYSPALHEHSIRNAVNANPTREAPANNLVHQLVSAQAAASPQRLALAARDVQLSYGELERRANVLSQHLRSVNIGEESIVALWMKRSPSLIVTALAALKSGAAYLPIDPEIPRERVLFMLRDCGAKLVVTDSSMAQHLADSPCPLLKIDRLGDTLSRYDPVDPQVPLRPDSLAYVIYTSGSTGLPKGVEITHGNLANLVAWHNRAFEVGNGDCASHLAGLGFDASVWETWPYLAAGASLWLVEPDALVSPENLRDWLITKRITISFVPTPLAERMLPLEWPQETTLRVLLTGGDTLHVRPREGLPFKVFNNYGPTECTVVATSGVVLPSSSASLPSIGNAIDNTQVYILNDQLQAVTQGDRGELYVGGANVGRGYCNRPDLTAERFIASPFVPGAKLYRTGDLAQCLPNGEIAFLGRADNQIKIRGYRIEPDEIAAVLNTHPGVTASAVIARGEGDEKRLVAYVVPNAVLSRGGLQEFLLKSLPDYMVPATYVLLDALPLTLNGKLDSAALPAPSAENTLADSASEPGSEIEAALAQLVTSLLNVPEVGPEDDFFLLGGHSLLGTQLIARIRDKFDVDIALRTLFEQPTVRALSTEIERLLMEKLENMSEEEARTALHGAGEPIVSAA